MFQLMVFLKMITTSKKRGSMDYNLEVHITSAKIFVFKLTKQVSLKVLQNNEIDNSVVYYF